MARKKKNKAPEAPPSEGWLVSYADMMTLLFATFVILWAFKTDGDPNPTDSISQIAVGIKNAIKGEITDIPKIIKAENKGYGFLDSSKKTSEKKVIPRDIKVNPDTRRNSRVILDTMKKIKKDIDVQLEQNQAYQKEVKHSFHEVISLVQDSDGFRIRILASSLYAPGQYKLKKSDLAKIDAIGLSLKKINRNIVIEGHTDSQKPRGKLGNWELSSLRAGLIAEYFIDKLNYFPKKSALQVTRIRIQ